MVNPNKLLKDLKKSCDDFNAVEKLNKDGSYDIDFSKYKHIYEGSLGFYWETGFEGSMACLVEDDRGLHEDGFHRSLSWAVFIHGGEFLEVYDKDEKVWEGLLIRNLERTTPYFLPMGVDNKLWEDWFKEGSKYRAKIYTNKPVLAEDPEWKDKYE